MDYSKQLNNALESIISDLDIEGKDHNEENCTACCLNEAVTNCDALEKFVHITVTEAFKEGFVDISKFSKMLLVLGIKIGFYIKETEKLETLISLQVE